MRRLLNIMAKMPYNVPSVEAVLVDVRLLKERNFVLMMFRVACTRESDFSPGYRVCHSLAAPCIMTARIAQEVDIENLEPTLRTGPSRPLRDKQLQRQ